MISKASLSKKMKIIVTGGAGFIGSNLADYLLEKNFDLIIVDDLSTGKLANLSQLIDRITFVNKKVEDINFNVFEGVDAVVHLAAQASVPLSIVDFKNSSKINLLASINVIDYCSSKNIPLVYASSSAVYGGLDLGDDEVNKVDLLSPYAADKFCMELYAGVANKLHNLSSVGLRFFNVYGPRQDPSSPYSGVISIFVNKMVNREAITINGGYQTRDFIFVNDIVNCIYKSLLLTRSNVVFETVNVLTGVSTSIDSLVDMLSNKIGHSVQKKYQPLEKGDVEHSSGTQNKMAKMFNIDSNSFTDMAKGLEITIDFLKLEDNDR